MEPRGTPGKVLDDENLHELFLLMAQGLNVWEALEEFFGESNPLSDKEAMALERLYDQSRYGIEAPRKQLVEEE